MLNKLEVVTVSLSVLYIGFVIHALTVFFMDGGLEKLGRSASSQDISRPEPFRMASRPYVPLPAPAAPWSYWPAHWFWPLPPVASFTGYPVFPPQP